MRHFFITTFERLMNVLVVLTGVAILVLSARMGIAAEGNPEALLWALLVFLGGFVTLFAVAGCAFLAISNHQNLRRMVTLIETSGRAARPLTATRGRELPPRRIATPVEPEPEIEDEYEAEPEPSRASRLSASLRRPAAPGINRVTSAPRHQVAEPPRRAAEPPVSHNRAEPVLHDRVSQEPELQEAAPVAPVLPSPPAPAARIEPAASPVFSKPVFAAPAVPAEPMLEDMAFEPGLPQPEEEVPSRAASIFSGRAMPKPAPRVATEPPAQNEPAMRPFSQKGGRLVADRRPPR